MNQENTTRYQLLSDEIAQEIYETLTKRTKRSFDDYEAPQALPNLTIPGELALFLDDIFEIAEAQKDQDPADTLAEILDLGIVAWCAGLDSETLARLGLPALEATGAQDPGHGKAIAEGQEREAVLRAELERERVNHEKERDQLAARNESTQAEMIKLRKELELLDEQGPTNAETAQVNQRAQQYEDAMSAYTPLTSHSLGSRDGKNGASKPKRPETRNTNIDPRRAKRRSRKRRPKGPPSQ